MVNNYYAIKEQLNRIEKKLDGKHSEKYLDINQVSALTTLSLSTLHRRVATCELKCSKKLGKLLFLESDV